MSLGKHKWLVINCIAIIVFIIGAFVAFTIWLNSYTAHGESVIVPTLSGLDYDAAKILAENEGLKVIVNDTMCVDNAEPGSVVDHYPIAGSKVKAGRTIYLSINSMTPLMVVMPKVTDVSLRQATQMLENKGLKVGAIEYKPDFANNYVFEQRFKSKQIEPGTKIPKGSLIDLLVGQNAGNGFNLYVDDNGLISIPSLIGLSWSSVRDSLIRHGLNVNPIFNASIKTQEDTMKARVQRQSPEFVEGGKMSPSEIIDVWFDFDPIYDAISDDMDMN